jgi:hypothetical protein
VTQQLPRPRGLAQQSIQQQVARRQRFFARLRAKNKATRAVASNPSSAGWTVVAHRSAAKNGLMSERAWTLWHRPHADADGWHSFVLRHNDERFRKFSYWGGWDGSRLAKNADLRTLHDKHPKVYAWLEAVCRRKWNGR